MKKILLVTYIALLYGCDNNNKETELIQKSFTNYKNAVLHDQGKEAIKYVDTRTVNYYRHILDLVKTADSITLEKSTLIEKFFVLAIRHTTDKDTILNMNGNALFIYAIEKGMIGKENAVNLSIGNINFENDFATADFESEGKNIGIKLNFYEESGQWKADFTSIFQISNVGFKNLIKSSGLSPNECMTQILNDTYGRQNRDLWKPSADI